MEKEGDDEDEQEEEEVQEEEENSDDDYNQVLTTEFVCSDFYDVGQGSVL